MYNKLICKYLEKNDELIINDIPVSVDTEINKIMKVYELALGYRPTVLFKNVINYKYPILMNPYKRKAMLVNLGIKKNKWLMELYGRYYSNKHPKVIELENEHGEVESINDLPIIKYRINDCGFYITSGITVTKDIDTNKYNLGIYRIKVNKDGSASIFMAENSDGYKNLLKYVKKQRKMPVVITVGAEMIYYLLAAAKIPNSVDDYKEGIKISNQDFQLVNINGILAPIGQFEISGYITGKKVKEGNFGEFKGYYVNNPFALELIVSKIYSIENPVFIGIAAGAESGLTLSAMQGEWLLYKNLVDQNYNIKCIEYRIEEAGEFVAVIQTEEPSEQLISDAFAHDKRLKIIFCGKNFNENPWKTISIFPFKTVEKNYNVSNSIESGKKIGFLMIEKKELSRVEI